MIRVWLGAAAAGGFLSVAAGAVAAHLASGEPHAAELLRTGALYGMVHAAALVAVAALAGRGERVGLLLAIAGWSFISGIALFSFSLFALALTGRTWLALFTPFGGTALLIGWAGLGLSALRRG
jgi:uncharacterized membrane protein YgdD (TMEM256/DUF423 family)